MRQSIILGMVLAALAGPAFSQAVPVTPVIRDKLPPEGYKDSIPTYLDQPAIKLNDDQAAAMLCQSARIMSASDSAEYQPGVDAYGRAVAPADANTPVFELPERVDVPVNIAILKNIGAVTAPTPDLATNVGTVSVMKGGQVQFNGRDLTNNVTAYCAGNAVPTTPPPFVPAQQAIPTQQAPQTKEAR